MYPRLASNLEVTAYPDLINVAIPGMSHYIWLNKLFSPSQFDSKPIWLFPDLLNTAFEFINYEEKTGFLESGFQSGQVVMCVTLFLTLDSETVSSSVCLS